MLYNLGIIELLAALLALGVVLGVLTAIVYVIGSLGGWWHKRFTVDQLIAKLEPAIRVYAPPGDGPFPTVLQLHGCGGALKIQDDYAAAAQAAGVQAIILDSLTPRGIDYGKAVRQVCTGRRLRGAERAGDLVAGLEMLRRRKDVDPNRIAVVGWSHGGWTIMDLLAMQMPEEKPHNLRDLPADPWAGVVGIELIYPFSGFPGLTRTRGWAKTDIPVDALVLEGDTVASPKDTFAAFDKARESGAEINAETWSGVTHAFEEDSHTNPRLKPDPARAAEAHQRYASWLKRVFGL